MSIVHVDSNVVLSNQNDKDIILVDSSSGPITITLPYAVEITEIEIKKIDTTSNSVILQTKGVFDRINNTETQLILSETNNSVIITSDRKTLFFIAAGKNTLYEHISLQSPTSEEISEAISILCSQSTDTRPGVLRISGECTLTSSILCRGISNLIIDFEHGTRLHATFSGSVTDPDNAIFRFEPIEYASTTLSGTARKGSPTLSVSSSVGSGITVNSWIRITGSNAADPVPASSDAATVVQDEIIKILSASTNTLTPHGTTRTHQATGKTVMRIEPCRNITLKGGALLDASSGSVAVGVKMTSADRIVLDGLKFVGFSRAAVYRDKGSRFCKTIGCHDAGETNGTVHEYACVDCEDISWTFSTEGLRYHAHGLIRAAFRREWSTGSKWAHLHVKHKSQAFMDFGSLSCTSIDVSWDDLDPTEFISRMDADSTEWDPTQIFAIGYWIGIGEITRASYGQQLLCMGMRGEQTETPQSAGGRFLQIDFHDVRYSALTDIILANRRAAADMDGGLRIHDVSDCEVRGYLCQGIRRGLWIQADPNNVRVLSARIRLDAADVAAPPAVFMDTNTAQGIKISNLFIYGGTGQFDSWAWGANFLQSSMFGYEIEEFANDPYSSLQPTIGRITMARFTTGGPLFSTEVVSLTGAVGDRVAVRATGPGLHQVPVIGGQNASSGYCWIQDPSRNAIVTTDGTTPVRPGDLLVASSGTAGLVVVNNSASLAHVIGRAAKVASAIASTMPTMGK